MLLSVVAPCYNEEEGLKDFYIRVLIAIKEAKINEYEFILVDDGSSDKTWEVICSIQQRDPCIRGFKFSRNFGHQAALTAGLNEAKGDIVFIIDSDLQDPPDLLKPMLNRLEYGFDVVYGKRKQKGENAYSKKYFPKMFYRLLSLLADVSVPNETGHFRLMNRKVLNAYNELSKTHHPTPSLIGRLGFKQTPYHYDRQERYNNITKKTYSFSLKPLRIIVMCGVLFSMIATMWTNHITVMLILNCVQLICLGLVGEYIGKMLAHGERIPLYYIQEKVEGSSLINFHEPALSNLSCENAII